MRDETGDEETGREESARDGSRSGGTLPGPALLDRDPAAIHALGEDVPLLEGIRTARAIRRLRPDPVPTALVRKVCEAGTYAPNGGNRQPWFFVAVVDPERRNWIAERYRPIFRRYIAPALERAEREDLPDRLRRNMKAALHLAEHLHEAPVLLFVAGWMRRGEPQLQALYPCAQNVLLACRAVGLGASFTTLHRAFGEECDAYLGLPPKIPSAVMIPIGWPQGRYGRPPRRPVDEKLFFDRFDASGLEASRPVE